MRHLRYLFKKVIAFCESRGINKSCDVFGVCLSLVLCKRDISEKCERYVYEFMFAFSEKVK